MKSYELTVLVRNEADMKSVKTILDGFSAKVGKEEKMGKRELTYPIKKETSAFYSTCQIEIKSEDVEEFKKKMNYDDAILRYLLLSRS